MILADFLLAQPWFVWLILLPLGGAASTFVLPRRVAPIGFCCALLILAGAVFSVCQLTATGSLTQAAGHWSAPLGIVLRADGLAVVMLATTAGVGFIISCYALGYFPARGHEPSRARYFWPLWLFVWAGCNALYVSADLFNLYVTLEIVTLAAVALTALEGGAPAVGAALRYLLTSLVGSLTYLAGVALLYAGWGTVDLSLLSQVLTEDPLSRTAMALMICGLLLKSALFPLHFWLPPAHGKAPAPVSAILSALVVKTAYVVLLRLWFEVFASFDRAMTAHLLGALGSAAIIWGSLMALRQERLKLLIAYSTVAQIGYLFLVFPLAGAETAATVWTAVILFMVAHACGKAAMFLVAGTIQQTAGHDRISQMAGAGGPIGVLAVVFALASVTIIGLPPSGGFFAKWLLLNAALATGQWWYCPVILTGSLLAAAYVTRVLSWAFLDVRRNVCPVSSRVMKWPPLALCLVALLLGLAAYGPVRVALTGAPVTGHVLVEQRP